MRSLKPDLGHLIKLREDSRWEEIKDLVAECGLDLRGVIIRTYGIRVEILIDGRKYRWIRRDQLEVIQ